MKHAEHHTVTLEGPNVKPDLLHILRRWRDDRIVEGNVGMAPIAQRIIDQIEPRPEPGGLFDANARAQTDIADFL